jgi:hypothetical protein
MPATSTTTEINDDARLRAAVSKVLHVEIERQRITTYEAIKRAGLRQSTGRDVFGGSANPKLSTVLAIEAGLGQPAGWLAEQTAFSLAADAEQEAE